MPRLGPPSFRRVLAILVGATHGAAQTLAIRYLYDEIGLLPAIVDSDGASAIYPYDAVGNILAITRHSAGTVATATLTPHTAPLGGTVTMCGVGLRAVTSEYSVTWVALVGRQAMRMWRGMGACCSDVLLSPAVREGDMGVSWPMSRSDGDPA